MKFHRSPAGLSNLHLFLGSDVVVFVEGGPKSFSVDEALQGNYSSASPDIKFWQSLFTFFLRSGQDCQFRAIGSKHTAIGIADLIVEGRVSNVLVAMDRDHDSFRETTRVNPSVLYTRGYSWENDVCRPEIVEEVFWSLSQGARGTVGITGEIRDEFQDFCVQLRRAVYIDILLAFFDQALLPRDKPDSVFVVSGPNNKPRVNKGRLMQLIRKQRELHARPLRRPKNISFNVLTDCVGPILACFYYRVLQYLLTKHSGLKSVQKTIVDSLMIEKFIRYLSRNSTEPVFLHYSKQFAALRGVPKTGQERNRENRLQLLISYLRRLIRV